MGEKERSMAKKLLALFLCMILICGLMQTAFAVTSLFSII